MSSNPASATISPWGLGQGTAPFCLNDSFCKKGDGAAYPSMKCVGRVCLYRALTLSHTIIACFVFLLSHTMKRCRLGRDSRYVSEWGLAGKGSREGDEKCDDLLLATISTPFLRKGSTSFGACMGREAAILLTQVISGCIIQWLPFVSCFGLVL